MEQDTGRSYTSNGVQCCCQVKFDDAVNLVFFNDIETHREMPR